MTSATTYEYDIFLSHNHVDQEWTMKLAERLEQENWQGRKLKVFFSPWDIRPSESIPKRIEEALYKSRKLGLIMSDEAMDSAWVEMERLVITYIAVSERQDCLIPLYRRTCKIPPLVKPLRYIDFQDDAKFEESYRILLAVIKDEPLPRGSHSHPRAPLSLLTSIPRPPVVGFVTRRDDKGIDILERLKEDLAPHKNRLVTLSGPGGVGKTTLAAEAARVLRGVFKGRIVWSSADARDDFTLSSLLDDTATQLGRTDLRAISLDLKEAHVHALVANPPSLVMLDNYDTIMPSEQERIEAWFALSECSALITSRQRIGLAFNITVAAMSHDEAQEFLEKLIAHAQDPQIFSSEVRQRIYETADANPFILQWVVRQIDEAQEPNTVLEELAHGRGDAAQRVFDRSFNLPQLGDDGRVTLLALSLFVPSATRPALADVAGFKNDLNRLNEAVRKLSTLGLIKVLKRINALLSKV